MKNDINSDDLAAICEKLLTDRHIFQEVVANFRPRPQQIAMAKYVAQSITDNQTLVIEAGTGIGKTFAYLLPAVLSRQRVVVSTHTRHLQDQIFGKDIPNLLSGLDLPEEVKVVLLKGRANYLCLEHLNQQQQMPELDSKHRSLIEKISRWSKQTESGDISEFKAVGEENPLWQSLTSTRDNCFGTQCKFYEECFVAQARKQALAADMIIVNHYLLMADMMLKEDGFGQLLPSTRTVIVDEAHRLSGVADNFLGTSFSSRQTENLLEAIKDSKVCDDTPLLGAVVKRMADAIDVLENSMQGFPQRADTAILLKSDAFMEAAGDFQTVLGDLTDLLDAQKDRSEEIQQCWQRTVDLSAHFQDSMQSDSRQIISWYQYRNGHFNFYNSPVEVAPLLREGCNLYEANWIYTSATLSVNGKFDYSRNILGLDDDVACVALDSPFDYRKQAVLYLPDELPAPNTPDYIELLLQLGVSLLEMVGGKAFFLFTSHKALQTAKKKLEKQKKFSLLVQGSAPKRELLQQFYKQPGALLLGTASFWEGVDVRGAGLRCVIVDRLPFASPQDPLMQGRIRLAQEHDSNFFIETQLPEAVVALRQGVGRLIRDEHDSGVVMIGDRRLWTKPYGKIFMNSLPPMQIYHDFAQLRDDWTKRQ